MPQTADQKAAIISATIGTGNLDDYLDEIIDAAVRRKRRKSRTHGLTIMSELEVGDTIRIGSVKPKLLQNRLAEVTQIKGESIVIRLLGDANRKWRATVDITLRPSGIKEIVKKAGE